MRILIVDDSRDVVELIRQLLTIEGYEVVIARDGLDALQQEASTHPDLIVLDGSLPHLSGWELCRRFKARRAVPIMILTVHTERDDVARSYDAGADLHLAKPFDLDVFLEQIRALAALVPKSSAVNSEAAHQRGLHT